MDVDGAPPPVHLPVDLGLATVRLDGGAILRKPAAVYSPIGKLPALSAEDQVNSTQHFFRELNLG